MSLIQTPWTSQPQQAVGIDWSNPLARTITHFLPLNGDNRELVTGASLTLSNGIYGVDSKGKSLRGSGTNACASVPLNLSAYNKLTVSFWLYWDAFANNDKFAFELTSDTNTTVGGFNVNPNSSAGTGFLIYTLMSSGFGRGRVYTRPSAGAWHHIFCTMDRTVPASSGVFCNLWIDGVLQTPTEIGFASAGANNFANSTLYLFSRNNASLFGAGRMQNLVFRGGYLGTELEAREEYRNPWQIFKPLPRRIFVPVSAATGDATGTGSFYDVTLSSPTGTATGTGAVNGTGTGDFAASSLAAPSATATGSALATGALTTVTLTTITASATGSALATGSLDAIYLSTVSGSATGTTAGNAEGVGSVATIALSAPSASAVGSALATGSFAHVSLSAVSGTASAATDGQATADLQPISISAPLAIAVASSVATGGIQSIGLTAPNASATGQAQTIARPGSDTSNSGWTPSTGSDLYAMLDEVTPNDADYISTASAGSVCRLGLGAVADPGTSSGQVVSYRASSSTGNGLKVELMQGGTVIATWNHATLPATDTTYQQSLSAAECDAITDYTALSVRLTSL